jgi:hypothetical protein
MIMLVWILQVLLGLHTLMGAVWKFTNSAQSVPSLRAIPHGVWMGLSVAEIACGLSLIVATFYRPLAQLAPLAALLVGVEMLAFCGLHLSSGHEQHGQMIYWLVVAGLSAFVAYGGFQHAQLRAA